MEIKRVAFAVDHKDLIKRLTTNSPQSPALFASQQKAMMFAAALGRHLRKRKEEFKRHTSSSIRYDIFQNHGDDGFIDALAVATTGDLKVLSKERFAERVAIFEEYAYAGFQELDARCYGRPGNPLDALVGLVSEMEASGQEEAEDDATEALLNDLLTGL
jgi:dnd system-associated protein 4